MRRFSRRSVLGCLAALPFASSTLNAATTEPFVTIGVDVTAAGFDLAAFDHVSNEALAWFFATRKRFGRSSRHVVVEPGSIAIDDLFDALAARREIAQQIGGQLRGLLVRQAEGQPTEAWMGQVQCTPTSGSAGCEAQSGLDRSTVEIALGRVCSDGGPHQHPARSQCADELLHVVGVDGHRDRLSVRTIEPQQGFGPSVPKLDSDA